jgi:hypothetical protein
MFHIDLGKNNTEDIQGISFIYKPVVHHSTNSMVDFLTELKMFNNLSLKTEKLKSKTKTKFNP